MVLDYGKQAAWPNGFGAQESPIALHDAQVVANLHLAVTAPYRMQTELDDGTTIKLLGLGQVQIGTKAYDCVQTHFHVPAEHVIDQPAALELHFVHQNAIGQLCVVAVLFTKGAENPLIQQVIDDFAPGTQHAEAIDLSALMPTAGKVYHYLGSLTTPPLTEGVEWYVIQPKHATVSAEQAAWFVHQFGTNNRDLQPRNDRVIQCFDLE
ncbi:carbonic anhydrase family protein [Lacticaseibacillus manihotivorans]|uniref:carbonic anhydrase n=2 Tax=Lacticaseibacillus manihotivorans TaxID=88233 RepID=A0A0R1Q4A8_9LACO|nr:carbonic anhydrase family protein [Lacticaseibacillus manihotivorans]KRL39437.1 carbonic anhydrase [Lacticaseibacillus manihotivorans DSM 13343 = JCM 12514]QFQ90848.1 carbonic anhydrase family protein [Lacticaseibacillus manihotivorans]